MDTKFCKQLIIFEGPDGSGKSTAAKTFAEATESLYVHFGPFNQVGYGLARMYVEAMLPALMGYKSVVFDRSWLSEPIYGSVFRNGVSRINKSSIRMLDRLAMRCGAVVINCQPELSTVIRNFNTRRKDEMLNSTDQLSSVYKLYQDHLNTSLSTIVYDYEIDKFPTVHPQIVETDMSRHNLAVRSAGNCNANILLVGDEFGHHKDNDPLYQWPFASFDYTGCSQWLTNQLEINNIPESKLCWVNSDQFIDNSVPFGHVIALGKNASAKLVDLKVDHITVPHPQYHKRFSRVEDDYELITILKELLNESK